MHTLESKCLEIIGHINGGQFEMAKDSSQELRQMIQKQEGEKDNYKRLLYQLETAAFDYMENRSSLNKARLENWISEAIKAHGKDTSSKPETTDIHGMTAQGRLILNTLQRVYKHNGDLRDQFQHGIAAMLSITFDVTIAWAKINCGGTFEAYFYNKESAEKVKNGLGWICEIKQYSPHDSGDFRLIMNV